MHVISWHTELEKIMMFKKIVKDFYDLNQTFDLNQIF